jgi:PAS domain S-box-containing protein
MKNSDDKRKIRRTSQKKDVKNPGKRLHTRRGNGLKELNSKKKMLRELSSKNYEHEESNEELMEKQNELQKLIEQYADLYDYAPMGYMSLTDKGVITGINLTGAFMLRGEKKYIINTPFISFLETSEMNRFFGYLKNCKINNNQAVGDFRINTKNGEPHYLKLFIAPTPDYVSKKMYFRVLMYDDSEKTKAEKALKESEHRFLNLADTMPVLLWMFDKDQKLEYVNKQRFQFTGLSAEQEANNWRDHIHPQDRELYNRKFKEAFKYRKKLSIEYRLKNHSKEYHWILENTIPRFTEDNEFLGLICTGIDITERKKARIAVEKSLKEKELLVKEIHHRVKNNLQIVSSLLNLQGYYIKDPKALDLIKTSQERIRSMALVHEKLYRSRDLLKINFEEYAKDLVSNLFQSYRKNINIRLKINISKLLLEINIAISLGLILNELVSNSLKHAFNGRKDGEISVALLHEKRNTLELIVSDDGIGLPKDFDIFNSEGMGLELVESLVQQHNGSMDILRDGRTEFRIFVQIHKEKSPLKEIKSSPVS